MSEPTATAWPYAGARWWRFDFHTHTPASDDYGKGPRQNELRARTPRDWLLDFMRAEIDCVAVTDHNTGEWIDRLKDAYRELEEEPPEGFRALYLFPGVEISVHGGVHVLAIFGPEKRTSDIDSLLGAVEIHGSAKGSLATCTQQSLVQVAGRIRDAGGLAIPAHVDCARGLLKEFSGQTLKQVLDSEDIRAMELCDPDFEKPGTYTQRSPRWSEVLGSDCHHPDGDDGQRYPGSHFTWVKMGSPSMEGLRLALLDGAPLSLLRSDQANDDPNEHAGLVIERIEIRDARYAGRGPALRAQFSPWMSTLIGGRGTGKSTVVEMLRLAMRREKELPGKLQEAFNDFNRVPESRADRGALTEETHLTLVLRKDGGRFRVHWRRDGTEPAIEEENGDGQWEPSPGTVRSRFPVRIFSQKQVFALASDPGALLRLIDEAPEVDRTAWNARWEELAARLLRLRAQARELGARLGERARIEGELADVRRQIAIFAEGSHRAILVRYQRLRRQRRILDDRSKELAGAEMRLREVVGDIEPSDVDIEDFEADNASEAEALALLEEAADKQRDLALRVAALANELATFHQEWNTRLNRADWATGEQETDDAYRALVERLKEEGVQDPAAYGALVQHRHTLERKLAELDALEMRRQELDREADATLEELEDARVELSKLRMAFLKQVLKDNVFVRITLVPFGAEPRDAETEFRKRLAREDGRLAEDILTDDGTSGVLAELYNNLPADPEDRIAETLERLRSVKHGVAATAMGATLEGCTKWFHNHVRGLAPEQIDRFDLWWPEDGLRVEYRQAETGRFVPIEHGSPGQKSAAILAFLLSHEDAPLVLDQPEDDLDNHLIYDLIVRQIRENKRRRQVIVATHNPNIVVNGDAEMVIAMDHRGGQCVVVEKGTGCLQEREVRDEVCRVMEGGRQAFENRYKRLLEKVDHG